MKHYLETREEKEMLFTPAKRWGFKRYSHCCEDKYQSKCGPVATTYKRPTRLEQLKRRLCDILNSK